MISISYEPKPINKKALLLALLINMVWINISEVFRYFVFVMPMMRDALPTLENVAPMSWTVFLIWGVWDTILIFCVTAFFWIYLERFGCALIDVLAGASFAWLGIFVILWLGLYNMNLTNLSVVGVALLLSWVELVVAALIVRRFVFSNSNGH